MNQKKFLVCSRLELIYFQIVSFLFQLTDKMISNEYLSGMPLLVLANKQDLPQCMGTIEIKPVFQQAGHLIGRRDCLIMPVSALTG
jgi:ADP-ribosylation factor related protein 1